MFKSKGLLKVMSIIMIVFAVISAASLAITLPMLSSLKGQTIEGVNMDAVMGAITPLSIAISIFAVVVLLAAGILGLIGKSFKAAMITGGIYFLYQLISMVINLVNGAAFGVSSVIGLIIPLLYLWGLYQCKE